jgi:acyl-CoA synthetase (AMP-forming)/AMP-acid ligase II
MSVVAWSSDLRILAQRFGAASAVVDATEQSLSYQDLASKAHALAAVLIARGLRPGDPVAVLLPNCLQAVWTSYGIRVCGAAEVSLNWGYTPEEVAWSATLVPFRLVLTDARRAQQIRQLGFEPLLVDELADADDGCVLPPVPGTADSRMMFTSGTTGRPKAVVYDHAGRWAGEQLLRATMPFVPARGERIVLMTPFPHGASLLTFAWCAYGAEVRLLEGVQADHLLGLLRGGQVAALFAPPTVLAKIAATFGDERFDGVRCVFTGTQALPASLYRKARQMFGPVVRITFGKTECVNPITVLEPLDVDAYYEGQDQHPGACVGWPAPGVEIRIRQSEDAQSAQQSGLALSGASEQMQAQVIEHGQSIASAAADNAGVSSVVTVPVSGEVWLRARHMSRGLIGPDGFIPHEPDGWHRTGDLGFVDDLGRLVLTGREADVIKTGGYRVNPDEIESLLQGLPDSGPVCVTSLPSEYWGEIIVAVAEQAGASWREQAAVRVAELSQHKRPRLHVEVDQLPRNPQGKLNRRQIARLVLEQHELVDGPYPSLLPRKRDLNEPHQ